MRTRASASKAKSPSSPARPAASAAPPPGWRREGARIVAVDLPGSDLAGAVAAVEEAGSEALAVPADVTSWADHERYVSEAVERFGGIDAFFNNGIEGDHPLTDYPEDVFDKVIDVNVNPEARLAGPRRRAGDAGALGGRASQHRLENAGRWGARPPGRREGRASTPSCGIDGDAHGRARVRATTPRERQGS